MKYDLGNYTTVIGFTGGLVIVTRPTVMGGVATHVITSPYNADKIAAWLQRRMLRTAPLVQDAFPQMDAEDREFLISGLTPAAWNKMFGGRNND